MIEEVKLCMSHSWLHLAKTINQISNSYRTPIPFLCSVRAGGRTGLLVPRAFRRIVGHGETVVQRRPKRQVRFQLFDFLTVTLVLWYFGHRKARVVSARRKTNVPHQLTLAWLC